MSELLGIKFPLAVVEVGGQPVPWVRSRRRFKLEGKCTSSASGLSVTLSPRGVPVILCFGDRCGFPSDPGYVRALGFQDSSLVSVSGEPEHGIKIFKV